MNIRKLICKTMILFPVSMMEQPSTSHASSSATSQLKCDKAQCGKVFRKYSNLNRHTRLIHGNENTASCHICAKKVTKPNLKRHVDIVHRRHKQFECLQCEEAFGSKVQLVSHQHAKQNCTKLLCEFCNRKFTYVSNLKQHKKICEKNPNGCPQKEWK